MQHLVPLPISTRLAIGKAASRFKLVIVMDTAATFAERLDLALSHLSPRQEDACRVALAKLGKTAAGPRGMVAVLADLPTPSVLADMTAGRTPGLRHREGLARVLGISTAWLNGDDAQCPDWCLEPFAAWERFAERLGQRWQTLGRARRLDSAVAFADPLSKR